MRAVYLQHGKRSAYPLKLGCRVQGLLRDSDSDRKSTTILNILSDYCDFHVR